MLRLLIVGFRGRHAVSTMIGGIIILTLILTGVTGMVFVSQQYDQYQQTVNQMAHYQDQAQSENLVANYPGLTNVTSTNIPGWGSGCTTTYNCYDMSLGNVGGVGVQIVRIYINSTGPAGSGCSYSTSSPNPQPCVLNPSIGIAPYTFDQANQFINAGETNHTVAFALPKAGHNVALPAPSPAPFPQNSIAIVTSRGNVFSFQWPFQIQIGGQSSSAFSTATIKVAYQKATSSGYDSMNEPGPVAGGSGGTKTSAYCHNEPLGSTGPPPTNGAEKITGITGLKTGTTLYFVNPWITDAILDSVNAGSTQMYLYVYMVNLGTTSSLSYSPTAGSLDLAWYSANHLDGTLLGVYYLGHFYLPANAPTIPPGTTLAPQNSYYAIYTINPSTINLSNDPSGITNFHNVMFWGDASITDWGQSNAETTGYFSATFLLSGFWIRNGCTT